MEPKQDDGWYWTHLICSLFAILSFVYAVLVICIAVGGG